MECLYSYPVHKGNAYNLDTTDCLWVTNFTYYLILSRLGTKGNKQLIIATVSFGHKPKQDDTEATKLYVALESSSSLQCI